jgi:hypothetical protein
MLVVLSVVGSSTGHAEHGSGDRVAVLEAVESLFDAMRECDPDGAREVLDSEGRFYRVAVGPEGSEVSHFENEDFIQGIADCSGERVERVRDPQVEIRNGMAMVWAPYDFWLDGELCHCGVNLFNLVVVEGRWKIVGGAYTFETEGCAASLPKASSPATFE